jgi:GAF domain-containing protein
VSPTALPGVFRVTPTALDAYVTSADVAHMETLVRTMENAVMRQRLFAQLDQRLRRDDRAAG